VGCAGAAAGGGTCGGGATGGAACGGGGGAGGAGLGAAGGGGGVGRGGAAAGGGAGRGGGGAAFGGAAFGGAPFGGGLGLPSGPSSSLAWAMTSGAVCACDGALMKCIAVRVVVASSTSRSFVMVVWVPGKYLAIRCDDQRISIGPECGGLPKRTRFYFVWEKGLIRRCSLRIQAVVSNCSFTLSPAAYPTHPDSNPAPTLANRQFRRRSRGMTFPVPAVPEPAIRPAFDPAIPPAAALRRDPASAAAPPAADFRAGSLAAAPTAVRA
jgi:hypothetical protein